MFSIGFEFSTRFIMLFWGAVGGLKIELRSLLGWFGMFIFTFTLILVLVSLFLMKENPFFLGATSCCGWEIIWACGFGLIKPKPFFSSCLTILVLSSSKLTCWFIVVDGLEVPPKISDNKSIPVLFCSPSLWSSKSGLLLFPSSISSKFTFCETWLGCCCCLFSASFFIWLYPSVVASMLYIFNIWAVISFIFLFDINSFLISSNKSALSSKASYKSSTLFSTKYSIKYKHFVNNFVCSAFPLYSLYGSTFSIIILNIFSLFKFFALLQKSISKVSLGLIEIPVGWKISARSLSSKEKSLSSSLGW